VVALGLVLFVMEFTLNPIPDGRRPEMWTQLNRGYSGSVRRGLPRKGQQLKVAQPLATPAAGRDLGSTSSIQLVTLAFGTVRDHSARRAVADKNLYAVGCDRRTRARPL
jgi:hypothetical protein